MKIFFRFFCIVLICCFNNSTYGQINRSQAGNYQAQKTSFHEYASNYQNGYVQLLDGTRLDGQISIIGYSYDRLYGVNFKTDAGEKYKFSLRSLVEFGLSENLTNDTPGEFEWYTVDKVKLGSNTGAPSKPSNTRKGSTAYGYVVTKEGQTYQGKISIKEVRKKIIQIDVKTGDKQKFKFEASQLSNFGVGKRKEAQTSGSTTLVVNDRDNSSYDSLDPVLLAGLDQNTNGYAITSSGEKIKGKITISEFPGIWFVRDVTLTRTNGDVEYYTNNGALKRLVFSKDGKIVEYVNFENEYVKVLDRSGGLIHIRNPHPSTPSTGGELTNAVTGAALESADQELRSAGGSVTKNIRPNEDTDWTSEDVINLYAKEYLIFNERTGKYAMYIPGRKYQQVEGDLMGSMHYLKLPKVGQDALRKMEKPLRTMNYLNEKIYSK
ncbi:hypothetical protein [Reichenbachiella sp.]|uniref:hypothetical protein n=1 Tax=Reichenbachiella sp. TaxID=2184521 RepID=UPI0032995181